MLLALLPRIESTLPDAFLVALWFRNDEVLLHFHGGASVNWRGVTFWLAISGEQIRLRLWVVSGVAGSSLVLVLVIVIVVVIDLPNFAPDYDYDYDYEQDE